VEVFHISNGKSLIFKYSVQSPDLFHLNDVYAVSPHAFYVTTWHYYGHGTLLHLVEKFAQRRLTFLSYCEIPRDIPSDQKRVTPKCQKVVDNLGIANGVNGSPDKHHVYLIPSLEKNLHVYERNLQNGSLSLLRKVDIGMLGDNIDVDPQTGYIYIGCHPKALTFLYYSRDPDNRKAPSAVLDVKPNDGYSVSELLVTEDYFASSVGVVYGNTLFVGGVYDKGVLVCEMDKNLREHRL